MTTPESLPKAEMVVNAAERFDNLSPAELLEHAIRNGEGQLADNGALVCDTGEFTGRSPEDRYIVKDDTTADTVWWGKINSPFDPDKFDSLHRKMIAFLADKRIYSRYAYAGAHPDYRLNLEVINTLAWHNLFCHNLFLRPKPEELDGFKPEFTILCVPEFKANPEEDGTRNENFAILNLSRNMILIGGTAYAGEMKKGIFSVLNFKLPTERATLSMHASANKGSREDTALFFGLSGTGKTTLSADPQRQLIGDDEHGWAEEGIFNFEGGCYAKVIDLSAEKEPQIYGAVRFGAVLENTKFQDGGRTIDYADKSKTENTRVAYPIHFIDNALEPSVGGIPENIFFLTADAFGVLPPISKLTPGQAMYHFISGYTAKVAGTEVGVTEPEATFSACFGAAFLPLHPTKYAEMLGEKMEKHQTNVWLINTGWNGTGNRIDLRHTRAVISAALNGDLEKVDYQSHPIFGVAVPQSCPDVPGEVLNPEKSWKSREEYDKKAKRLAELFRENFSKYEEFANDEIRAGGPVEG
ncbi:phosphoenolpyruvate carboxykinase (ATP) [Larkinella arboricola]|uniref:Phosphoenolpyruvate carboxykinase (ATP) n=1 Tax=Larkinella arboricola TaxID=643671 RepID=A0A327WR85_LARAB|nr:phosphoenolpyruvate carboxykinase (ATP) [Larkinella arboricola]RAJ94143.1 phosphoenolpyruvate carboxykinase (ATP) [Larkinella arboricola]